MGENKKDDYFRASHNTVAPDFMWKVIYRHDKNKYSAWLFPSTNWTATNNINYYNIALDRLLSLIPVNLGINFEAGATQVNAWPVEESEKFLVCEGQKNRI